MLTLIIHLISAEHRRENVANLVETLRTLPGSSEEPEVMPAVVGMNLSDAAIKQAYRPGLHRPFYPFALNRGEIGCFLSHRAAWQRLVDSDRQTALILEDDAQVDADQLQATLEGSKAYLRRAGFLQLQTRAPKGGGPSPPSARAPASAPLVCAPPVVYVPGVPLLRTTGQILNRHCAQTLLDLTAPFDRPVDTFLQMRWVTGLAMGCAYPSGVREAEAKIAATTLNAAKQNKTENKTGRGFFSHSKRLYLLYLREYRRARYRAAVKRACKRENRRSAPR